MIHHGDCLDVMAGMEPESVDAIVTDPPYGLEFMGKEWDKPWAVGFSQMGIPGHRNATPSFGSGRNPVCRTCHKHERGSDKCRCTVPDFDETPRTASAAYGAWSTRWAEAAYRVAKPSAYLLAFGGTRTVHRMTVALEDAGWIIRDQLMWVYLSGFPKSRASLKPSYEPIVLARKPGPLRMLDIEGCRIPFADDEDQEEAVGKNQHSGYANTGSNRDSYSGHMPERTNYDGSAGRWPANVVMVEPALGEASRVFLIPKADRADREPVLGGLPERGQTSAEFGGEFGRPGRSLRDGEWVNTEAPRRQRMNGHPTVKPTDLMRHLIRLVTPTGGTVLDPFLGSGTTALAAETEGFAWIGIEREAEYVAIAEARLNGVQRGLGLEAS